MVANGSINPNSINPSSSKLQYASSLAESLGATEDSVVRNVLSMSGCSLSGTYTFRRTVRLFRLHKKGLRFPLHHYLVASLRHFVSYVRGRSYWTKVGVGSIFVYFPTSLARGAFEFL